MNESVSGLIELFMAVAGLSGVAGLFWGIFQYRKSRIEKRKDLLFHLADKFDDDDRFTYAKKLLDDFSLEPKPGWENDTKDYHKNNFETILNYHFEVPITDAGYIEIRDSFDALFDFFDRLTYLYKLGLIKKEEFSHFSYYLKKAKENENVRNYVDYYEFNWIKELPVDV